MWKTRNIRRNKKNKTKRQDGGLLPFMGPSIVKIIEFAIKREIEVTSRIETKNGMLSKATISDPIKMKFIKGNQLKFIEDENEENKLDKINANIKPNTPYRYDIKGSKLEVILNVKNQTKIILLIDESSIKDIKDKMKTEEENKSQKIKEIKEKTNNSQLQKKEESKYEVDYIAISNIFGRDQTGTMPYSTHQLNYLYYCIETYFPEDSLTKDTVHTFVKEFDKYDSKSPEKEIKEFTKDDAMVRLEAGIKLFIMNDSKTKLQEIVKKLNVDSDQLDDYLKPKQSLNQKCRSMSYKTCFYVESLRPYADNELVLLDEDNPDEKLKMSIFDFVENGATTKEMWKNSESRKNYDYIEYLSKGTDADSLVGFVCHYTSNNLFKISNIIWADNDAGKNPNLHNKLYDIFNDRLSGKYKFSKLFIPDELNEKVNVQIYKKRETKDGFTMWDAIVPPKPTEIEIKLKTETNQKGIDFLKMLQKLQLILDVKPAESDEVKQTGGADNALLDEIITKYPSLKGLKSMIDDLPEDIRQKYASEIKTTLEKVKESNLPETDLSNKPEFQEIQADLNAKFPNIETSSTKTDDNTVGTPNTDTTVEPTVETPTDTTVETPNTEPTVESPTETTVEPPTDTTDTTETTVESPTDTTETPTTTVETPNTDTTRVETPTTTTVETPKIDTTTTTTVETPKVDTTTTTPTTSTTTVETPKVDTSVSDDTTTTVVTPSSSDEVTLKREDLKESPLLVQPTTGESGKYIFVPKDLVEKVIDYLLNNGCEVTTVNLK